MPNAALHRAEQEGCSRCRFVEPDMDARIETRLPPEFDLRGALDAGELDLLYQPIVEVASRRIIGFEALMRWRNPERGMVSPAEFVPVAEEIGLIERPGEYVLRVACAEAARWPAPLRIAVDLSPVQLRNPRLVGTVTQALQDSGVDALQLDLDITEGALLQRTEETLATLHRLRAIGVRIAMENFGTGCSTVGYRRSFHFGKVKIDRAFVRGLETRRDDAAIVHAATGLCARLGVVTTAEGVETEAQFERLAAAHCVKAQGLLFSLPVPAPEVTALLRRLGVVAQAA